MLVRGRIDAVSGVTDDTLTQWLKSVGNEIIIVHHILPQVEGAKWESPDIPRGDTTNPHYHYFLNTTYKSVQCLYGTDELVDYIPLCDLFPLPFQVTGFEVFSNSFSLKLVL